MDFNAYLSAAFIRVLPPNAFAATFHRYPPDFIPAFIHSHRECLMLFRFYIYALGKTVEELGLQNLPKELHPLGEALPKTLFSMMIPEITEAITKRGIASVVIFGIEVSHDGMYPY